MAQRLPRHLLLLAALVLLLATQRSDAQSQGQPAPPPAADKPKPPEPAPAAKELSKEEVDGLIEKAFGKNSAELKRPVRVWMPKIGVVIAAKEASIARDDGSIRFLSASLGIPAETLVFRGEHILITTDIPLTKLSELNDCKVVRIEIHGTSPDVLLTPRPEGNTTITPAGVKIGATSEPKRHALDVRFNFNIDPKTPLADLLPTPVKTSAKMTPWTNEDFAKVPELTFGEHIAKDLPKQKAMERTAHVMAKINHLNAKKTDGFMLAMITERDDLRGLPFRMGDECRTREDQAKMFAILAELTNAIISRLKVEGGLAGGAPTTEMSLAEAGISALPTLRAGFPGISRQKMDRAAVASASQIVMPESAQLREGLASFLSTIPHIDATKALAKLAIFSPEDEVRAAAIEGLKLRREKDYTDILIQGFRYPLPAVSKRAAEALVKLERKDLLANLVDVLESPDPRLPVTEKRNDKEVTVVRELVKINHHRNCLLCHAPGNTENTPEGVLKVAVPLPGEPLPRPSEGGYQSTPPPTPDIVVRLDMTYLRQDFSQMMPVSDAHPWPDMQRFDFLVRTRELSPAEAKTYCEDQEPGRLSPYHRSALYALRELTGRDTEPTAAAWRKLLKLAAR